MKKQIITLTAAALLAASGSTAARADVKAEKTGSQNLVGEPAGVTTATGKLLVFLPGTGGQPSRYKVFLNHATTKGFNVIGLSYDDTGYPYGATDTVANKCKYKTASCFRDERELNYAVVQKTLTDMFARAARSWMASYKTSSGAPDWSKIVIAGHSQGAGEAGFIAQQKQVTRGAIMFNGPCDPKSKNGVNTWIVGSGAVSKTPLAKISGIYSTGEGYLCPKDGSTIVGTQSVLDWDAAGMKVPVGNQFKLLNSIGGAFQDHNRSVVDGSNWGENDTNNWNTLLGISG